jgi:hypothetical protein
MYSFYIRSTGKLEYLKIHLPAEYADPQNTTVAIAKLLKVCPKLHVLDLDMTMAESVEKDCILAHCQTLRSLMLGTGTSGRNHSVAVMKAILEACTKLKWLAINMPWVNLGALTALGAEIEMSGIFTDMLVSLDARLSNYCC